MQRPTAAHAITAVVAAGAGVAVQAEVGDHRFVVAGIVTELALATLVATVCVSGLMLVITAIVAAARRDQFVLELGAIRIRMYFGPRPLPPPPPEPSVAGASQPAGGEAAPQATVTIDEGPALASVS